MKKNRLYAICVIVFGLSFSMSAWSNSLHLGSGTGIGLQTDHLFSDDLDDKSGWLIGDPSARFEIEADPNAGAWIKNLSGFIAPTTPTTYVIHEFLTVGSSGLEWTDWHEEIINSPGWNWSSGTIIGTGGTGPIAGLVVSGLTTNSIWFDFSSLPAGTSIDIWKEITCNGPCSNSITIKEFPTTVPIPAALWLFGSGLVGLVSCARRKKA